jgi:molybdate transport system ATP-binding protein
MIDFALQKNLHTADGEMQLNIECRIERGRFIGLYGASGAGKTSVLRMLAGLMRPNSGQIQVNGEVWFDDKKRINVAPQQRKIGFVFQDYALFPNMNVRENITFALRRHERVAIVDELLELTGLRMFAGKKIQTLSGGQMQRVALARAIAKKPQLLLLDEPLSAIDNNMRAQLQTTLLEVHERFALTTILVSHDTDEMIRLTDKIIHLEDGKIEQYTTASAFFLNGFNTQTLTGNIMSIEEDAVMVLISRGVVKIASTQTVNFKPGEKIELIYQNTEPVIRKL